MLLVITENELKTGFEILENTINEWLRRALPLSRITVMAPHTGGEER